MPPPIKTDKLPEPMPGDPSYMTPEEAKAVTLGRTLRLRASWPQEGNQGCGPTAEVVGIANCPHSQTNRVFLVRDKRERFAQLDAAWFLSEDWMDPFYEPPTQ
jgi:hypothetical protein